MYFVGIYPERVHNWSLRSAIMFQNKNILFYLHLTFQLSEIIEFLYNKTHYKLEIIIGERSEGLKNHLSAGLLNRV